MLNESRIGIYDYLYNLFYDVVTKNVYSMEVPQELTESDVKDGFIVISIGNINDESEFYGEAYARVRCYVEAYVPPTSRGRLDYAKYKEFEDGISVIINLATHERNDSYHIEADNVLSLDWMENNNANNIFFSFVKSFIVNID